MLGSSRCHEERERERREEAGESAFWDLVSSQESESGFVERERGEERER